MKARLSKLGVVMLVIGLIFGTAGVYAYTQVQNGYDSLQAFSEAQNVTLSYNDEGQLIDRGTTEGADAILTLLKNDWNYPVVEGDLNPDDPLVNTGTEYMYQMATIIHHVVDATEEVVLTEGVTYDGVFYEAGTHTFEVDGRYWTDFDRMHPIEGPARGQAWSGTVHGLVGELGVGTVTHSTLQMGLGLSGLLAGVGATFVLLGGGLVWATREREDDMLLEVPDTVPTDLMEPKPEDALV